MPVTTLIRLGRGPKGRQTIVGHFPHNANQRYILARGIGVPSGPSVPLSPLNGSTLSDADLFCNPVPAPANDVVLLRYNGPALVEGDQVTVTATYDSGVLGGGLSVNGTPGGLEEVAPVNFTNPGPDQWQWTVAAGDTGFDMLSTSTLENSGCYTLTYDIVNAVAPSWSGTPVPPTAELGIPYLYDFSSLQAGTEPITNTIIEGTLPNGLAIVGKTIAGTPV